MIILAIETSCDETAAAVVKDGLRVLSSVVSTQFEFHKPYSGVVPELASRAHAVTINKVIEEALKRAGLAPRGWRGVRRLQGLDSVAVTIGPGLVGSLLVGRMTAETLAWVWNVPVIGVNHMEGHLLSPILFEPSLRPPFLGLVASGGHTELIVAKDWGVYYLLGRTRDDAAGEAFDKVAKMMGLGYPGGPAVDQLAKSGDAEKEPFPRSWLDNSWDFSFSGLKTAVLYRLREKKKWNGRDKKNVCAGFQRAVVDVLIGKSLAAVQALGLTTLVVGGGVAANSLLRAELPKAGRRLGVRVVMAPPALCTDNAAMIATAAYFKYLHSKRRPNNNLRIQARIHLPLFQGSLPSFRPAKIKDCLEKSA